MEVGAHLHAKSSANLIFKINNKKNHLSHIRKPAPFVVVIVCYLLETQM
jgi:hypothetical protein